MWLVNNLWILPPLWILFLSMISFSMMGVDKHRAIHKKWRISEAHLWMVAILGGALGGYGGMQCFRHKTKHTSFRFFMPTLMVLQLIGLFCMVWYFLK